MRILIDIGHPAHVHLFKNFAWDMQKKGHQVHFTARDKEYEIYLLRTYNFSFTTFGRKYTTKLGKIKGLIEFDLKLLKAALQFKPDVFVSHGSIYAAHIASLLRKPHISMEDTGNMEQIKLYEPFTSVILAPEVLHRELGKKQIRYASIHELFYLHPTYFKPDKSIYKLLKIDENQPYCIIRFVAWNATHDVGQGGLNYEQKKELVEKLSKKIKVFISSEAELPEAFRSYQMRIPAERMHDALAFAGLFIGEGATMASECAVLGTPAIYVNSIFISYCDEQQKYGLLHNFTNGKGVLEKALEILDDRNYKQELQAKRERYLVNKIDASKLLVWFVENYPQSEKKVRENPDYLKTFRYNKDEVLT
jgi:uncharacterized protein